MTARETTAGSPRRRVRGATAAWLALLVLGMALIVWQAAKPAAVTEPDADDIAAAPLVSAPLAQWSAVELLGSDGLHRFERDPSGRWLRHAEVAGEAAEHRHDADAAAAERIATVLGAFSRAGIERRIAVTDPARLAVYGLDRPPLIVMIRGSEGRPVLTLEVGQLAPDGLSRYVRLPRDGSVLTIPNYQVDGLLELTRAAPAAGAPASVNSR